jgi:hypothetical protein
MSRSSGCRMLSTTWSTGCGAISTSRAFRSWIAMGELVNYVSLIILLTDDAN